MVQNIFLHFHHGSIKIFHTRIHFANPSRIETIAADAVYID